MSILVALLLGLLQGVTVFLPVSNSGHLAVLQNLLKLDVPSGGLYGFLMNTSTLISILLVFRQDIGKLMHEGADFLRGKTYDDPMNEGRMAPSLRILYFIIIGTVPLLLTTPIGKRIDVLMGKTIFVGLCMVAMGVLLFVTDKFVKTGRKSEKTMTVTDAFFIGLGQAFSIIPGLSRTGITTAVGLSRGLKRDFTIRFSIFLSLPSVIVAILASFFALFKSVIDWSSLFAYIVAFIISVATGYLSIQILRIAARKRKLRNFAYYLWVAGVVTVILSFIL